MSSLFFARRSPAARLRTAYRRHRATPRHSIVGPVVLAIAIATAGHHVAAAADHDGADVVTRSAFGSVVALRTDRASALMGEPVTAPDAALRARAVWPAGTITAAARTPARATRSTARTAVAKPRPKVVVRKSSWVRPSGGPLTSPYGRRWGRMHEGLDFGAGYGSPVKAAFDGVIVSAGYEGGYGKQIRIRHASGITTTYSHLSKFVRTSGRVKAGELIGKIGSTGSSTGPHLHFEVLVRGANVNPRPFLSARGVRV